MNLALIQSFVTSLHDDEGVPEGTYLAICDLLSSTMGEASKGVFTKAVDATDGRFYLPEKVKVKSLWNEMMKVSSVHDDNELMLEMSGFSREEDNSGQIVLYTSLMEKGGKIVPFEEEEE